MPIYSISYKISAGLVLMGLVVTLSSGVAWSQSKKVVISKVAPSVVNKAPPVTVLRGPAERLTCMLGTEDRHARIGVDLVGGRVKGFAYYSKWKPRTCSVNLMRNDAYSQWQDSHGVTVVHLSEDMGEFMIEYEPKQVKFIFHDIQRDRFCGMPGKISGSLTVRRGQRECVLEGVMDGHAGNQVALEGAIDAPAEPAEAP
jgi:hypothetical protein